MNNDTEVSIKFRNSVTGEKKLKEYSETLTKIRSVISGIDKGMLKEVETTAQQTKEISKNLDIMGKKVNIAFNYTAIRTFGRILANVTRTISKAVSSSASYLENMNLLDVAFNNNTKEADKFVNKLSEMYGLDESWGYRTVGIFKQLANAMGVSAEAGDKLATILTQLSIDTASLYNIDTSDAVSIFSSALAGQTKPARRLGADITQTTLQTTLDNAGIERYIVNLSYAEKRLLIVASLLQQLQQANNDWGRTIESVANQTRILHEQWNRFTRAIGNMFLPMVRVLLPYLNAILMVLTEIINSIAVLLGYNPSDFDFFTEMDESVVDLAEGLGTASENAKKLKQGLRGFDKLNNITTPSASSSGVGSGLETGIDPSIMELFNKEVDKYNSKLTDVQMKATKIRDRIMEWLGYTKQINPLTGEVSFKYGGIKNTLKNLYEWFVKLKPEAKVLVGYIGYLFASKTIKGIGTLVGLFGKTGLYKSISTLLKPTKDLIKNIKDYIKYAPSLTSGFKTAVDDWKAGATSMEKISTAISGIAISYVGVNLVADAMNKINEKGVTLGNTLEGVAGSLSTIIGGTMVGASIGGGTGAIIGGITGTVVALVTAIANYKTENEKMLEGLQKNYESHKKYNEELKQQRDLIEEQMTQGLVLTSYHEKLLTELKSLTNENGKIKSGYEDRAKFIVTTLNEAYGTELEIINGAIKGYDNEIKKIQDLINTEKARIVLKANEEAFTLAIQNQASAWERAQESLEKHNKLEMEKLVLQGELYDAERLLGTQQFRNFEYIDKQGKKYKGMYAYNKIKKDIEATNKAMIIQWETFKEDKKVYEDYTEDIVKYDNLKTAILTENQDEINKAIQEYTNVVETENGKRKQSNEELLDYYKSNGKETLKIYQENGKEITEEIRNTAFANYTALRDGLIDQTSVVEELTPEIVKAWGMLATDSKTDFINKFSALTPELKTNLKTAMESAGYQISDSLQNGIDSLPTPKIKVDVDTSKASNSLSNWLSNLNLNKILPIIKTTGFSTKNYADGGLPPVGQIFVANEKGAELVGNIGGQSFVANQNQMMDLLDKKIGNAQTKQNQTFNIYLDPNHKIGTYTLEQLEDMAKTNGKAITIGG